MAEEWQRGIIPHLFFAAGCAQGLISFLKKGALLKTSDIHIIVRQGFLSSVMKRESKEEGVCVVTYHCIFFAGFAFFLQKCRTRKGSESSYALIPSVLNLITILILRNYA